MLDSVTKPLSAQMHPDDVMAVVQAEIAKSESRVKADIARNFGAMQSQHEKLYG